jgi:polar amino acid transport system substrate-binding protein
MKRIMIFALTAFLALGLLVSCSSSGGSETKEKKAETEAAKAVDEAATSDADPEEFLKKENIRIAVQAGTVGDFVAQDYVGEDNVDQFARYVDAITAVVQDKAQGAIMDLGPAQKIVAKQPTLVILNAPLTVENYAFGLKKGNSELLSSINEALKEYSDDGTLQKIFDKYINEEEGAGDDIDMNVGAAGGKLVMGTESGFAPYEMLKGDKVIGIDVEIMALIAKSLDKELVVEDMQFDALIPAVVSGKIDVIAAGLTVTEERKESIDFSDDYVVGAKQVLVVKADDLP